MQKLRFYTSGESHGRALVGILEGIPAGLTLSAEDINIELKRRQGGYGRGGRMKIESDQAIIISGIRWGKTLGSPISILLDNKDWINWEKGMSVEGRYAGAIPLVTRPRPGHADLAGVLKYGHIDVRNVLERSSARETAMRVALGAIAKKFLSEFGIKVGSYVTQIGTIKIDSSIQSTTEFEELFKKAEESPVRCPDSQITEKIIALIDEVLKDGDTLGGVFVVFVIGLPPGLGSHIQWDKRLDGLLAQAIMSIQAIKGVEIGLGFQMADKRGSEVMDEIFYDSSKRFFYRKTNNAGGIEGGMTNAMPLVLRAVMKPIPTLRRPLRSVDIITKEPIEAIYERSDICAVPAASVIAEAMTSLVIADAFLEKFGGDNIEEVKRNFNSYIQYLKEY